MSLSEAMCFGLGAGLGIWYLDFADLPVSRMLHVRSMDIEARFFARLDVPFAWEQPDDPPAAEAALCSHLDQGRAAVVQTDIYYLPHYPSHTHFPGHLIAVWGYDPEKEVFWVTDTENPDLLPVPFRDMRRALYFRNPVADLRGNLFAPDAIHVPADLGGRIQAAVAENSRALAPDRRDLQSPVTTGIAALHQMRRELPLWQQFPDWQYTCRFAYQVIEKRGTGGAGFRLMYGEFLAEAARYVPEIRDSGLVDRMQEAAGAWRELAAAFKSASERERPDLQEVDERLGAVIEKESAYHQCALQVLAGAE
jgi:hypothetical protein